MPMVVGYNTQKSITANQLLIDRDWEALDTTRRSSLSWQLQHCCCRHHSVHAPLFGATFLHPHEQDSFAEYAFFSFPGPTHSDASPPTRTIMRSITSLSAISIQQSRSHLIGRRQCCEYHRTLCCVVNGDESEKCISHILSRSVPWDLQLSPPLRPPSTCGMHN